MPAPPGTPGGAIPGGMNPSSRLRFVQDLLAGVNAQDTPGNEVGVLAWMKAEGGTAHFNPLNTTQHVAGSTSYNSAGVQNYPSHDAGVQATVQTLSNGKYAAILGALRGDSGPQAIASAIGRSPWGTNGTLVAAVAAGWGNRMSPAAYAYANGTVEAGDRSGISRGVKSAAGALTSPLGALGTFLGALLDRSTWIRLAEVIAGLALGLGGLFIIARAVAADQVAGLAGKAFGK